MYTWYIDVIFEMSSGLYESTFLGISWTFGFCKSFHVMARGESLYRE